MDKVLKRREANRRSQQRSRSAKEALIKDLQEENDRLRAQQSVNTPGSVTEVSASPSVQPIASVDLEACRQAVVGVLASVCDPHLNTIHAVCSKFAESRGRARPGPDLQPPRPVNRPLNMDFELSPEVFAPALPSGPGLPSVPIEPERPLDDLEMDHQGIWIYVLSEVDLSQTDAEALAARLASRVRCYGYGPVMLKSDVAKTCAGESPAARLIEFPSISPPTTWNPTPSLP